MASGRHYPGLSIIRRLFAASPAYRYQYISYRTPHQRVPVNAPGAAGVPVWRIVRGHRRCFSSFVHSFLSQETNYVSSLCHLAVMSSELPLGSDSVHLQLIPPREPTMSNAEEMAGGILQDQVRSSS